MGLYLMLFLIQSIFSATANKKYINVINYIHHILCIEIKHTYVICKNILIEEKKSRKKDISHIQNAITNLQATNPEFENEN